MLEIINAEEIGFPKIVLKNEFIPIIIVWVDGKLTILSYTLPMPPPNDIKTHLCPPEHPEIYVRITFTKNPNNILKSYKHDFENSQFTIVIPSPVISVPLLKLFIIAARQNPKNIGITFSNTLLFVTRPCTVLNINIINLNNTDAETPQKMAKSEYFKKWDMLYEKDTGEEVKTSLLLSTTVYAISIPMQQKMKFDTNFLEFSLNDFSKIKTSEASGDLNANVTPKM